MCPPRSRCPRGAPCAGGGCGWKRETTRRKRRLDYEVRDGSHICRTVHTLSVRLALCRLMTDKNDSPAKPERHIAHQSSSMAPNSSESSSLRLAPILLQPTNAGGASSDQHCRKGGGRGARWRGRSLPRRRRRMKSSISPVAAAARLSSALAAASSVAEKRRNRIPARDVDEAAFRISSLHPPSSQHMPL